MRNADRVFVSLSALAFVSGAILVALLASLVQHLPRLLRGGALALGDVVPALILLLASIGIALGLTSLARQLWETLGLIRRLLRSVVVPAGALLEVARPLGLAGRIDVVADERPFAFAYWFLRPRVCLSTALLERLAPDELRAVLAHERYHLTHRDPLRLVLARYFAAGLYVVPVIDDLVSHYAMLKEVAADEDAVRTIGSVRPLARALYRLMPGADELDLGLLAPVGGLTVTEARIEQLVEPRPIVARLPLAHIALSATTLAGALVLLLAQAPAIATPAQVALAWPPAAVILLAAVPGVSQQIRAVTHR